MAVIAVAILATIFCHLRYFRLILKLNKSIALWILPAVLIASLTVVFVDIERVIGVLKLANPSYVLAGVLLTVFWLLSNGLVLYSIRYVLDAKHVSIRKTTQAILVADLINQLTPFSRFGGQPACAKILSEHSGTKTGREVSYVVLKYVVESIVIYFIGVIGILYYAPVDLPTSIQSLVQGQLGFRAIVLIIIVPTIIATTIFAMSRNKTKILNSIPDFIQDSLLESKKTVAEASVRELMIIVTVAIIPLVIQALSVTAFSYSLSIEISPPEILLILMTGTFLNVFIPSTGFSGTQESMIVLVLMAAKPAISTVMIVSLVFLTSIISYTVVLTLGIISIKKYYSLLKPDGNYLSQAYNK